MAAALEIPLRGPKGEPVDFVRTIVSHGVAELLPNEVDLEGRTLETTLPVKRGARTVRITADKTQLKVEVTAGSVAPQLAETVSHMFRLNEDLSAFHELVSDDDLSWCATVPDACFARRRCSRMSSRRTERRYEPSSDVLLRPTR